jgi:outer membrane protein
MKRLTLLLTALAAFAAFALLASVATTAQDQPTKIVFVDSQAAISAHPSGAASDALQEQASEEISSLRDQIQGYTDRIRAGQQLTPEENEVYQTLLTTIQSVQQFWQQEISTTAEPALVAVNEAIAQIAEEEGYTIVMEFGVSASSGLVVYAQDGLDITATVIARVSGGN